MFKQYAYSFLLTAALLSPSIYAGHPMPNEMNHGVIEVPVTAAPLALGVKVFKDAMSGFNLHLQTQNFELEAPEFGKQQPNIGIQGHAHLYINEKKIGRLYTPYFHIAEAQLKPGINMIAITLNNHMHSTWQQDNKEAIIAIILNTYKENAVQSIHSPFPIK